MSINNSKQDSLLQPLHLFVSSITNKLKGFIKRPHHKLNIPHQPPLLLFVNESNPHDNKSPSLYSLSEQRFYDMKIPLPHDRLCAGSTHGWLTTVHQDCQVTLFNPFMSTNNEIKLPLLTSFYLQPSDSADLDSRVGFFLSKVVLSANPNSNSTFIAIAIYSGFKRLAFFKPGDREWTTLDHLTVIDDVIYHKDRFLAVNAFGEVFSCDLNSSSYPVLSRLAPPLHCPEVSRYIVKSSSGALLQVLRHPDYKKVMEDVFFNTEFEVFKFDEDEVEWTKVDNLDGQVLFLGCNTSLSISASEFPELKPDSIYFADDNDMGVFSMVDRTVEPLFSAKPHKIITPPIWVEATL